MEIVFSSGALEEVEEAEEAVKYYEDEVKGLDRCLGGCSSQVALERKQTGC